MQCEWIIQANAGEIIQLEFAAFKLEDSTSCSYDNVKVFDGNSISTTALINKYCGSVPAGFMVQSTGTTMRVRFESDSGVEEDGFKLLYRSIDPASITTPVPTTTGEHRNRLVLQITC